MHVRPVPGTHDGERHAAEAEEEAEHPALVATLATALGLVRLVPDVEHVVVARAHEPAALRGRRAVLVVDAEDRERRHDLLEREARRNLEAIWLLQRLTPDDKTIADFRKDNGPAIKKVCARFVELCRQMGLLTKASVAIGLCMANSQITPRSAFGTDRGNGSARRRW